MKYRSPSRLRRMAKWAGVFCCVFFAAVWAVSFWWDMEYTVFGLNDSDLCCGLVDGGVNIQWGSYSFLSSGIPERGFHLYRKTSTNWRWLPTQSLSRGSFVVYIPSGLAMVAFAILTIWLFRRDCRPPPGYCLLCGYNLTGNKSGRYPECGATVLPVTRGRGTTWALLTGFGLLAASFISVGLLAHIFGFVNAGLPFGYWGDFNRVKARLESVAGLQIYNVRLNHDISLEDFTFDVTFNGTTSASLFFHEAPASNWQLFDNADGVRIYCDGLDYSSSWWFDLGPDADLETELGCEMRNVHNALSHFGELMELIRATPTYLLDEQRIAPEHWQSKRFLVISVDEPGCGHSTAPEQ